MPAGPVTILGIESSCDETAAAIVRRQPDGKAEILSNIVLSQLDEHAPFGGVVPEIAARAHIEVADYLITRALSDARLKPDQLDAIAATAGPGLIGGVIVGLMSAKGVSLATAKPLLAINHLEGHALSVRLTNNIDFPYLLLLVSGGHSQLVIIEDLGRYTLIGTTIDDAIGEAFDKTAKLLGLGFPGGPAVERYALKGDPGRFELPRPLLGRPGCDFSLSGLKTALRRTAERIENINQKHINDLCASFQNAIGDILEDRIDNAFDLYKDRLGENAPKQLVAAGGVAANKYIRERLEIKSKQQNFKLILPPANLCTDNAAMIAWAGAERFAAGEKSDLNAAARARWPLAELTPPN